MINKHGVGNLAKVIQVFEANSSYKHITISKQLAKEYEVRFLDQETKMVAQMYVQLVYTVEPIDVSYATYPDAAHLGLRNTFMLSHADIIECDKYWARKVKPKAKRETRKGMLGRMSKEVIAAQIKDAKALLASLTA